MFRTPLRAQPATTDERLSIKSGSQHSTLDVFVTADPQIPNSLGSTLQDIEAFFAALPAGKRLIGIDAGTKTLGLALSDVGRSIASPLETIKRSKFSTDAARLLELCREHQIAGIVLGLPINLDGTEGPRAQSTRAFARNLNKLASLPILLWDERLTTAEAERMLIDADQSRRRRAEVIDKLAATIILQNALDRMRGR
jgi:putative Holliday junction resolvase